MSGNKVRVYDKSELRWYLDGKLHREDGPAIENIDGTKEWYINGTQLTEQEHTDLIPTKKSHKGRGLPVGKRLPYCFGQD